MSIHEKHIELIEAVNASTTQVQHDIRYAHLRGFRDGIEAAGLRVPICDADLHYIDQDIDRPMCCGVWLDWKPGKLIHNGVGIADMYPPDEFENAMRRTNGGCNYAGIGKHEFADFLRAVANQLSPNQSSAA